jgi:voltage-gated potassium channel
VDRTKNGANRYPGVSRFSVSQCLTALVIGYISIPFLQHVPHGLFVESLLITVVMLFSLLAVAHSTKTLVWAIVLAAPAFAAKWIHYLRPELIPRQVAYWAALVFCVFVVSQMFLFLFRAKRIDSEVLSAGVVTYLLIALSWAFAYDVVAMLDPGAFTFTVNAIASDVMVGFTGLYYSFSCLTTVGLGDIVPVSGVARMLTMAESTVGVFYMAMMISRLVTLYYTQNKISS